MNPCANHSKALAARQDLIEDGRWHYWYDGENHLIRIETSTVAQEAGAPHEKILYGYDAGSRRVSKQVYLWRTVNGK